MAFPSRVAEDGNANIYLLTTTRTAPFLSGLPEICVKQASINHHPSPHGAVETDSQAMEAVDWMVGNLDLHHLHPPPSF